MCEHINCVGCGNKEEERENCGSKGGWKSVRLGTVNYILRELMQQPDDYRNFLRMDAELFQQLVALVSPLIMVMRGSVNRITRCLLIPDESHGVKVLTIMLNGKRPPFLTHICLTAGFSSTSSES